MENERSAAGIQDSFMMKSVDPIARSTKGRSDATTKRLKNRERQRRYRARKRLEAETKRPYDLQEAAEVQVELQPNGNHNNFVTRRYSGRDWKKDARRAHLSKHHEMNGSIDHSPKRTSVPEVTRLVIQNQSEAMLNREIKPASSSLVNNETPRLVPGRRDWKAEARRKKN